MTDTPTTALPPKPLCHAARCRPAGGLSFLRRTAVALFLLASVLPRSAAAAPAEPLRLSLSLTPLSLPFFVANSQGYFAAEGLQLKITEVTGGHRTMQQLEEGSADLATSSEAVVMFNSFQHDDFAIIASFVTSEEIGRAHV